MKILLWMSLFLILLPSWTSAVSLRLMTGTEAGTNFRIGQEIAAQTEKVGIHLEILPSTGSWQNIAALYHNDTEFAIFQLDAFKWAAENLYRNVRENIHDEIKVVMPLYHEEIHVLKARDAGLDFDRQKVFTVGCGQQNSGSCLSADIISGFYDKQFHYVYDNYETALDLLRRGELDLVIMTAGKPVQLLNEQSGLDLVSLPRSKDAVDLYLYTTLEPGDYPWLDHSANTYSVRSVLATMIQEQEGLANNIVGSVHFSIQVSERQLKQAGHPKWNDVQFQRFAEGMSHEAVRNSIAACSVIKSFGYYCSDLVTGSPGSLATDQP